VSPIRVTTSALVVRPGGDRLAIDDHCISVVVRIAAVDALLNMIPSTGNMSEW
jgi:hypothetical protein